MAEYIEREAALEECDWYAKEFCECEYAIMPLKGALENLHATDVRPVARGQWVDGKCNQCGERAPFWSMATTYYRSRYCPNCGAEMEES